MRKFLSLLVLPLIVFLATPASAAVENWEVESFDVGVLIQKNGRVQVSERIVADFGFVEKHGIYRIIPVDKIKFKLQSVKQDGTKAITKVTKPSGQVKIRIGNPDFTITGRHTYEINYEVGRVINRFNDHDEFYWNVTGDEWTVPIKKSAATVAVEGGDILKAVCYTGVFGSQGQECTHSISEGAARFATSTTLEPGSGFTIVNGFPKNLVEDPFYIEDILKPLWLIFGSLLAIFYMFRLWWEHGRDMWYRKNVILNPDAKPETKPIFAKEVIVAEFDPPPALHKVGSGDGLPASKYLRPAEVGTLIDEKIQMHDVSATIVDLAVRGYLKIIEEGKKRKKKYRFEKLKEFRDDKSLAKYEKEVLRGIFEKADKVELDDLKYKFYKRLQKIRDDLYERTTVEGYFVKRPDKVKLSYIAKGALVLVVTLGIPLFTGLILIAGSYLVPFWILGALMIILSFSMPKKTAKGTEAVRRASGFKLFISKAEKYHQEFNERINRFDQFLPYAMVFGVVDKWVKTFDKLGIEPPQPSWYVSSRPFSAANFASSMSGMSSSMGSTLAATPGGASSGASGFGGGGFSGGGFGGGGGGGW